MLTWQRWSASDIGHRRTLNEDALVLRDEEGLWAVIDGLGGADVNNVASAAIQHALDNLELAASLAVSVEQIEEILLEVHGQLSSFAASCSPPRLLGGTVGILRITARWAFVAWVGDVRLYRFRQGALDLLTEDHVQGNPPELTRLIGTQDMLPDVALLDVHPGDRYLLCSDGVYNEVNARQIAHWMARDPAVAQRELIAEALANGGRDNLSLILLDIEHNDD